MADIAKMAGVTKMTVSLALRGNPRISEKTRIKIQKLAEEHGYNPDPVARSLGQKKKQSADGHILGTIAHLISSTHDCVLYPQPEIKMWHDRLAAYSLSVGYRLDRFLVGPTEKEQKALSRILKARGIRSILIDGENFEIHDWKLDWDWFATVTFSSSMHEHFVHNIMSSSYQDVYDAVGRLAKMGYKRPGYFIADYDFDHWQIGFFAALKVLGIQSKRAVYTCTKSMTESVLREHFQKWFGLYQPDVVISTYDDKIPKFLNEMGLQVPKDVGFFGLDIWPDDLNISGLIQMRDTAYKTAVDLLCGMMDRHEYGPPENPMNIEIPSVWNDGSTLCFS